MKDNRSIISTPPPESTELERPLDGTTGLSGRYPGYRDQGAGEGFQLMDYWRAVRKRLWLVAGITVLITTLAAIYMARRPNIYQSHSIVQVDLEQVNPDVAVTDKTRSMSNPDPAYFNTQLQLLTSESLLRRVIKERNYDTNKDFLAALNAGASSPLRSFLKTIGMAGDSSKKDDTSDLGSTDGVASADEIVEAKRLAPYVELIRQNLSVDPVRESRATVKDTRLIEIAFRNSNPVLAADVANAIAGVFTTQNQEKRNGTSRKTNDFLQERIANLQSEIAADEQKYVELTQKYGILPTEGDTSTIVIDRLSGLNKALLEAENARKNAEANYFEVQKSPERLKALSEAESQRFITEQENKVRDLQADAIKKIADLRQERDLKLQEYKETAPEIKEIDVQINSYQGAIDNAVAQFNKDVEKYRTNSAKTILYNLQTKYLQAKANEDKIRADFNKQFAEASDQNQSGVSLKLLKQRIDTNKGFLDNLRKQVSGNDIAAQGSDNNVSVTEFAVPSDTAVSPRRLTTVAAAMFLSTLFGIGLALFLEYLDDTIRTTEEIENFLQLPALAAIPTIDSIPKRKLQLVGGDETEDKHKSELLIHSDSRSSLAEAYRQLRTSILLSTAGHAPKSLLITSSLPAEGKTTTATNTAISLSQTGADVLIIDADMRRPRLHSVFDISNAEGLSTILSSDTSESEILKVIQQDPASKLFILPSGPVPPNPAELIGSAQMAKLLTALQKHFTHVVVDSPPIASFTDGVLIASMVDGVILVVHSGKSSRQVVKRSRQLLQDIGAKVFGVVLNNVNLRSQDNYYYYQSYYHRNNYTSDDEN